MRTDSAIPLEKENGVARHSRVSGLDGCFNASQYVRQLAAGLAGKTGCSGWQAADGPLPIIRTSRDEWMQGSGGRPDRHTPQMAVRDGRYHIQTSR
jgi:hypothetical protein